MKLVAKKRRKRPVYFVCPHCGADVPVGAPACRECGSDAETGCGEDADKWGADIPSGYDSDDDFDYDEFVGRQLPENATRPPAQVLKKWAWRIFVVIVGVALLICLLRR